jgi:hypothetical protein
MRAVWTFLILCMMTMSLFAASMVHANEDLACMDSSSTQILGHVDGDGDQVPADSDNGYPHHHGACHGHQVTPQSDNDGPVVSLASQALPSPGKSYLLPAATVDPALRPPQT